MCFFNTMGPKILTHLSLDFFHIGIEPREHRLEDDVLIEIQVCQALRF